MWTGIRNGTKSVSGDYRGKYQDLDNLLGVKYYFISKDKSKYDAIEQNNPGGYLANVPFDFEENKWIGGMTDFYNMISWGQTGTSQFDTDFETTIANDTDIQDSFINQVFYKYSIPVNKLADISAAKWQERR